MESLALFKECLKQISVRELNERISNYKARVDLRTITESQLTKELNALFGVHINDKYSSFFLNSDNLSLPHHKYYFYRIRKFTDGDYKAVSTHSLQFPSLRSIGDIWAKPANLVDRIGRLNREQESILYAASNASIAIHETDCQEGHCFFLFIYENKGQMRLSQIHSVPYLDEFTEVENAKRIILHNFLLSEFTKIVPKGREYLYRGSISIYEQFFRTPQIQGFCYPSTRSDRQIGFNIAFENKLANDCLDFKGLMMCKMFPSVQGDEFTLLPFIDGFVEEDGSFSLYPYNSPESRKRFGDFILTRDMGL